MRRSAPGYQRRTGWRWHFVALRWARFAFTVARRAGADVVGRARGTADRLSLSHSQRCHLQPHAARTSRLVLGTVSAVMLSASPMVMLALGAFVDSCWSAPWPRCIGRVCGARGSTLLRLQFGDNGAAATASAQPIQKVNTDAPPQAQVR